MKRKKLTEEEIDELVVAEANDMTKWGKPVAVRPNVIRFVEERIKLEEELLSDIKRGLKSISNQ